MYEGRQLSKSLSTVANARRSRKTTLELQLISYAHIQILPITNTNYYLYSSSVIVLIYNS